MARREFLIPAQDLNAGPLSFQTADTTKFDLERISLVARDSASGGNKIAITETITVEIVDETDPDYGVQLVNESTDNKANFVWVPQVDGNKVPVGSKEALLIGVTDVGGANFVFVKLLLDI